MGPPRSSLLFVFFCYTCYASASLTPQHLPGNGKLSASVHEWCPKVDLLKKSNRTPFYSKYNNYYNLRPTKNLGRGA